MLILIASTLGSNEPDAAVPVHAQRYDKDNRATIAFANSIKTIAELGFIKPNVRKRGSGLFTRLALPTLGKLKSL